MFKLLKTKNTVFTFKEIAMIIGETNMDKAKAKINYYVKKSELFKIRKGIYAKDKTYNKFEFANKLFKPSYISFETVLIRDGIIFQSYSQIFAAAYLSREIVCDRQNYVFRKIKNSVLLNSLGIEKKENYAIAAKERAFLDMIYLNKEYYFDNLGNLDFEKCFNLAPIYENKSLIKRLNYYYKLGKKDD